MKANVVGWGWVVEERDGWNGNPELCWARLLPPSVSDPPLGQPHQSGGSVKSRDLHPQALRRGGPSSCALSPKGSDKAAAETATHASVEDTKPHIQGPPSIVCEGSVIRGGSDIVVMNVWRRSRMGVSKPDLGEASAAAVHTPILLVSLTCTPPLLPPAHPIIPATYNQTPYHHGRQWREERGERDSCDPVRLNTTSERRQKWCR